MRFFRRKLIRKKAPQVGDFVMVNIGYRKGKIGEVVRVNNFDLEGRKVLEPTYTVMGEDFIERYFEDEIKIVPKPSSSDTGNDRT